MDAGSDSGQQADNPARSPAVENSGSSAPTSRRPSTEGTPPPLPPRPNLSVGEDITSRPGSSRGIRPSSSHNLQSKPTTAVSLADTSAAGAPDGVTDAYASLSSKLMLERGLRLKSNSSQISSSKGSDAGDSASLKSYVPGTETPGEDTSIFGDIPGLSNDITSFPDFEPDDSTIPDLHDAEIDLDFNDEFDPVGEVALEGNNVDEVLEKWKNKRKHFLILSAAGKPIYTRHGDSGLISDYIGIIQTIISFYQESDNPLKSFLAGNSKIVVLSQGSLYLVAISKLHENEAQLRVQLDALYMQILSTLTLPSLNHIFSVRPSTDLSRPLQGTESLLSSLADSFTKGSPSALLSALECLKIRKSHRQTINNTLLKAKVDSLLYGLVVASGKLVSVIRPKKHSLHPGDLQLIFNMIFEADGVKAGGGESWIPICLPGFNSSGYLYMYVSFLDVHDGTSNVPDLDANKDDCVAIILISVDKESFYVLREMRNAVVEQMVKNGSIDVIRSAIEKGRPATTDIVPGTVVRHFLYKSKANVQFTMSTYDPEFSSTVSRRRLLSIYHCLHASVHAKSAHVKVEHCVSSSLVSLAWITPVFELYCVAGPHSNRNALSQSANKIAQWVHQEWERVFIIGGAVF